jgi:hypothetical protein
MLRQCCRCLEHEFSVLEVQRVDTTAVKVIIEQAAREGPCPVCGVVSGTVKDRPWMRLKDLPVSGQTVQLMSKILGPLDTECLTTLRYGEGLHLPEFAGGNGSIGLARRRGR